MKRTTSVLALLVILSLGACQQQQATGETAPSHAAPVASSAPGTLSPEQLGALGAQIRKEPSRGDELLQQHGLTRQSFEKAIRDVTESADASRRYAEAYRKASA